MQTLTEHTIYEVRCRTCLTRHGHAPILGLLHHWTNKPQPWEYVPVTRKRTPSGSMVWPQIPPARDRRGVQARCRYGHAPRYSIRSLITEAATIETAPIPGSPGQRRGAIYR